MIFIPGTNPITHSHCKHSHTHTKTANQPTTTNAPRRKTPNQPTHTTARTQPTYTHRTATDHPIATRTKKHGNATHTHTNTPHVYINQTYTKHPNTHTLKPRTYTNHIQTQSPNPSIHTQTNCLTFLDAQKRTARPHSTEMIRKQIASNEKKITPYTLMECHILDIVKVYQHKNQDKNLEEKIHEKKSVSNL